MVWLCPQCASEEVRRDPEDAQECSCGNCGARFKRDSVLVALVEAEGGSAPSEPVPVFSLKEREAGKAIRRSELAAVNRHSDADEINRLLENAQDTRLITVIPGSRRLFAYPLSISDPASILAVEMSAQITLLGYGLDLRQGDEEGPVAFTLRLLGEVVEQANGLAGSIGADAARLDRLADLLNAAGPGADLRGFFTAELRASGRVIREVD